MAGLRACRLLDGSRSLALKCPEGTSQVIATCSAVKSVSKHPGSHGVTHGPQPPAELPAWAEGWGWGCWGREQAFALMWEKAAHR